MIKTSIIIVVTLFLLLLLNLLYPLDIDRLQKPKSTLIYDKNHQLLSVKLSSDGYLRIPIKSSEINQDIKKILLGYEDHYFYNHFGINPLAITRVLWFNLINQKRIFLNSFSSLAFPERTPGQLQGSFLRPLVVE